MKLPLFLNAYAKLLYYLTTIILRFLYKSHKTEYFSADRHDKMVSLSPYLFKVYDALVCPVDRRKRENYFISVNFEGCKLFIRPLSHVVDILMVSGLFEPYVKAILDRDVKRTDVIVDVGANIGVYAIPLAKRTSKVIAFEPHEKSFEMLEKSVKLNHLDNVVLIKKAASDSQKNVIQDISHSSAAYSKILTDSSKIHSDVVEVKSIDLNSALAKENKVDWLLIDVEGYEVNVLMGATRILQKSSPKIIIEVQPGNLDKVNTILTNEGYSITNVYGIYYYAAKLESR